MKENILVSFARHIQNNNTMRIQRNLY